MQEYLEKIITSLKDFFLSLSSARKLLFIFTISCIVAGIYMIFSWAGGQTYTTLYQDLAQEDSTRIIRMLREKNIPFRVDDGGKKIMLPPEKVLDFRLEASTLGLPIVGVVGYEVFDKESFGTTSFVQKLNKSRALEGELMRTINNLRGVKRSRVHLAIPKESTFIEDGREATASVVLELRPGYLPNESQINGITYLVASAVSGLESDKVTVVSSKGKRLSRNFHDPLSVQASERITMQMKVSRELEERIEAILGKVVGDGKVIAKVQTTLDFDETAQQSLIVDDETKAVESQVTDSNKLLGQRPSPQGVPGARSNIPGEIAQNQAPMVTQDIDKKLQTTNYSVPKTIRHTKKDTGKVSKITAAVMIDKKRETQVNEAGETVEVVKDWSKAELDKFRSIVASTLGIDSKRGDELKIEAMAFQEEDMDAAERELAALQQRKLTYSLIQYAIIGLAIIAFFILVVRPFIKWLTENSVDVVEDFLPQTLEELEKLQSSRGLDGMDDAIPELEDRVDPEKIEGQMIKEKILSLIQANPDKAAMIVHNWVMMGVAEMEAAEKASGASTAV